MAGDSPRPVTLDRNELGALPVAAAVGAQRFLLFTRNSNPGKSVENSTWVDAAGPDALRTPGWQIARSQFADRPAGSARLGR